MQYTRAAYSTGEVILGSTSAARVLSSPELNGLEPCPAGQPGASLPDSPGRPVRSLRSVHLHLHHLPFASDFSYTCPRSCECCKRPTVSSVKPCRNSQLTHAALTQPPPPLPPSSAFRLGLYIPVCATNREGDVHYHGRTSSFSDCCSDCHNDKPALVATNGRPSRNQLLPQPAPALYEPSRRST